MNAFISYSHSDAGMLQTLHKHLAMLKREQVITTWTDNEIQAGSALDATISDALSKADLFIALLSPDYLASHYCYEIEFQTALQMYNGGKLIIVPLVVEPCDWHNTPFSGLKALPKDGKAVSLWSNVNVAFLDIIQNLRKLVINSGAKGIEVQLQPPPSTPSRTYKVKKEFDAIQKMEFVEQTFSELKECMKQNLEEIVQLDNIKARTLADSVTEFRAVLVNRNLTQSEAELSISTASSTRNHSFSAFYQNNTPQITYTINPNRQTADGGFALTYDEYHLFWQENNNHYNDKTKLDAKQMASAIWTKWLESVGIH